MIKGIVRLGVGNPVAANLVLIAIAVCGLLAYTAMPREVFPDFSMGQVEVSAFYPGAAPEDVERLVTLPLEEAIEGTDGLDEMVSSSREGVARIVLTLEDGVDTDSFLEEVRSAVTSSDVELPDEVDDPWVHEVETVFPVISVFVYGWASEAELRAVAEDHRREIEGLPGVSDVTTTGLREPRIWIEVEPLALERFGLGLEDVGRAIEAKAKDVPLGSLSTEDGDWLLRVDAQLDWARDLENLPVLARPDGAVVRLAEVARLSDTFERQLTRARFNGQPCLHMQVNKKADGDTIDIAAEVRDYIARERSLMPAGTALGTNADLSIYVENRLRVMKDSGAVGALLVLGALLAFLNLRVAFVTALGIPVSFLGGLFLASMLGVTMNMVTMFALIVVLGMIVDDAIVVGENVFRLMEEGETPERAAIEGTAQVGKPVLATILTSIAAFLPILMLEGVTGNFMRPLPLVVGFCLLVSLVESLAILPAHLAHWVPAGAKHRRSENSGPVRRWYSPLQSVYMSFLALCLRWRYVTLAAAIAVAVSVGAIGRYWIPFVFFDDFESKLFYVSLRLDPGASLDETERAARAVEAIVMELPESERESVHTLIGVSASDVTNYELAQNLAQVWIELREGSMRTMSSPELIEDLRGRLAGLPPSIESWEIGQPQSGPSGRAVDISVRGPELATLQLISDRLQESLRGYAGTRDVRDNLDVGKREVRLTLDDAGRSLGFTEGGLAAQLRTSFEGTTYGHVRRGKDDVELVVKLPERVREDRATLELLRVRTPTGQRVPLTSVVRLTEGTGPSVITHDDRQRSVSVICDINKDEGNAADIIGNLAARHADLSDEFPGYRLAFKGDHEETAKTMAGLRDAGIVSLALIYLILGTLFRSFAQPLVIMFVIPFGAMGTILGHLAMGRSISMMSLIGLLALTGVVVNDSLILVEFVNVRRREGARLMAALLDAGRVRFRPIVLTSVTTMLGLTPLTFFATGQARFLQPMAISIFYGLSLSTVFVLVLVPCAYAILEDGLALARHPLRVGARIVRGQPVHT